MSNVETEIKRLRNDVQELSDQFAIMKRKYEDIIYNLDDDNFSSRMVKEKGDMKTAIEVNAEGIKTKVSNKEFESTKIQTAELIESKVSKVSEETDSKIEAIETTFSQRADAIELSVTTLGSGVEEFKKATNTSITGLGNEISEKATEILGSVYEDYETKADATDKYNALDGQFASYTKTEYLPDAIRNTVSASYITGITDNRYATTGYVQSQITTNLEGINTTVKNLSGTVDTLNGTVSGLSGSVSSISQKANQISTKVAKITGGKFTDGSKDKNGDEVYYTLFTQTSDEFFFDGEQTVFTGCVHLTDNNKERAFSIWYEENNAPAFYLEAQSEFADIPLIIGYGSVQTEQPVHLHTREEKNLIATQGWVKGYVADNAGSGSGGNTGTATAVFG